MRHFEVSFDNFKIVPGKWYHIVVSHQCFNPPSLTKAALYVNGVKKQVVELMYPVGELSQLSCNFGTAQPNNPHKPRSQEAIQQKRYFRSP